MTMHLEAQGLISDAALRPDAERISYFTALCPLRSGTILAGFQVGRLKHGPDDTIGLCRSARATDVSEINELGCLLWASCDISQSVKLAVPLRQARRHRWYQVSRCQREGNRHANVSGSLGH